MNKVTKKIDAKKLYLSGVDHPETVEEKLVLELASAYQDLEPNNDVVTMVSQEKAAAYFNEHGFVDTLDHMLETKAKKGTR